MNPDSNVSEASDKRMTYLDELNTERTVHHNIRIRSV